MKRLKKLLKKVLLISFIEDLFDPELGYDADTERIRDLQDALEKRIKYDESEFAAKVYSFNYMFVFRCDYSNFKFEDIGVTKTLGKEFGRLFRLFRKEYPGNTYRFTCKEFNAELCADAFINFIKEHESELSSEFVNRAIKQQNDLKRAYEYSEPQRTKEEQAEYEKNCAEFLQKLKEDALRHEMNVKLSKLRREEERREYESKNNSESVFQRFKTILYATIRIYF